MKVNVLGTTYDMEYDDPKNKDSNGECYFQRKEIVIKPTDHYSDEEGTSDYERGYYQNIVIRHELIHAFFFESGMERWAYNESLVNFLAMQIPKMVKTFQEVGCLEEDKDDACDEAEQQ